MITRQLVVVILTFCSFLWAEEPEVLYLTWIGDPTSSMVVQWHTGESSQQSVVAVQKVGEKGWKEVKGWVRPLKGANVVVHGVELERLDADTEYAFRVGGSEPIYRFQTMPARLTRKVRFIEGGDVDGRGALYRKMNQQMASYDPDFAVLGGDIAYTTDSVGKWQAFLKRWKRDMVTSDGRLIPMLVLVGNHDVSSKEKDGMFYDLFAFPRKNAAFREVVFGDYLSLVLLDSHHTWPIESQTEWLQGVLKKERTPLKMVAYHVAAFPSYYSYNAESSVKIREEWVPLFERYGVDVVFEHHNHCYKRTPRIGGVLYLGDGAWGVSSRHPYKAGYLAKTAETNVAFVVTLEGNKCTIEPRQNDGQLIEDPIEIIK